jgi:aspartate-semialdehyde dehydrogenase
MDRGVPLVIPELNPEAMKNGSRLFSVPNCSTIILLMAAKPLHDAAGLKRVVVSTYQAVSGAGAAAIRQLEDETRRWASPARRSSRSRTVLPHPIAFNLIPQVDTFLPDGFSKEEQKFVDESRKILGLPRLQIVATTVRVPVWRSHSEAAYLEFRRPISPAKARSVLSKAPGVRVFDDPPRSRYPMPLVSSGTDEVWVGRIRRDPTVKFGLCLFVAGDQLRKGAATTAVQIAELALRTGPTFARRS